MNQAGKKKCFGLLIESLLELIHLPLLVASHLRKPFVDLWVGLELLVLLKPLAESIGINL